MLFEKIPLQGAYLLKPQKLEDNRGFFARAFCAAEFVQYGLNPSVLQCNVSFNRRKATLRGMHYQATPHAEAKLVRCTAGAIHDVIVDLKPESATYCRWFDVELSSENRWMLYVPEGFAHGYLTLTEGAEVFYQVSQSYVPESERGVRWNDPAFGIQWPIAPEVISERDSRHRDFVP
jgi:dTDP-4-dehydrorhamnose 3,5-epimerase